MQWNVCNCKGVDDASKERAAHRMKLWLRVLYHLVDANGPDLCTTSAEEDDWNLWTKSSETHCNQVITDDGWDIHQGEKACEKRGSPTFIEVCNSVVYCTFHEDQE